MTPELQTNVLYYNVMFRDGSGNRSDARSCSRTLGWMRLPVIPRGANEASARVERLRSGVRVRSRSASPERCRRHRAT